MALYLYGRRSFFFFFNDTATTEIYTLSLHDALPICDRCTDREYGAMTSAAHRRMGGWADRGALLALLLRSEEHTSELQSLAYLVCRLLLEKKKTVINTPYLSVCIAATSLVTASTTSA